MKNPQALFSCTLIALMALAGLHQGVDIAWKLALVTAALAFFTEEIRDAGDRSYTVYYLGNALTILSWLTGASAGLSLLIYA